MKEEVMNKVYNIAHDIKAPLSSIKGLIRLSKLANDEEKYELIDKMDQSVIALEDYITKLLDKALKQQEEIDAQKIDLKALIEECVDMLQWVEIENKPHFEIEILPYTELVQDEWQLKRILHNLISNAIKHRYKGRPLIVSIKAVILSSKLLVNISDNGQGMFAEQLDTLFDKVKNTKNDNDSHGMGLNIVKDALDRMGGDVKINSFYGKGSHFLLRIPNRVSKIIHANRPVLCEEC